MQQRCKVLNFTIIINLQRPPAMTSATLLDELVKLVDKGNTYIDVSTVGDLSMHLDMNANVNVQQLKALIT